MLATPSLPSPRQSRFSQIVPPQIQRSSFERNLSRKLTFDPGWLVPIYVDEVLPGDTINLNSTFVARLATLLYPIMDNLHLDTFHFFAPARILWDNWKRFNGERLTPEQSIDLEIPILAGTGGNAPQCAPFDLGDYLGLPVGIDLPEGDVEGAPGISALPFRMYNMIWNEWFRDQNVQGVAFQSTGDGPDAYNNYIVLNRGKRHDYFSSCLPWPQKGEAVALPLGTTAPVIGDGQSTGFRGAGTDNWYINFNNDTGQNGLLGVRDAGGAVGTAPTGNFPTGDLRIGLSPDPLASHVYADLSDATAATIYDLREAIAIQQLLELDARGGTRYREQLLAMWGVTIPDATLQRPEYLGGSTNRIDVRAVAQTAPGETPQASLSAYGQMVAESGFMYSANEHGYIMTLVNVRADITYQQGIHKMWQRSTRYDFYQPPLAHLSEQPVLNREIYYQNTSADQEVFGYQERWAEYRYGVSGVAGAFRSNYATPLDAWHLALYFTQLPELTPDAGDSFIVDNPPIDRVVALDVQSNPGQSVFLDSFFTARWARPMPVYSTPGLERI